MTSMYCNTLIHTVLGVQLYLAASQKFAFSMHAQVRVRVAVWVCTVKLYSIDNELPLPLTWRLPVAARHGLPRPGSNRSVSNVGGDAHSLPHMRGGGFALALRDGPPAGAEGGLAGRGRASPGYRAEGGRL